MPKRTQTYYHPDKDEDFDYEKFYYSIYSFTDPIVEGDHLRFTTMFLHKDEEGRPYAKYKISDQLKLDTEFIDEAEFLEKKKLYVDEKENEDFIICQMYQQFEFLEADKEETGPLAKKSLSKYFGKEGDDIPNPGDFNYSNVDPTIEAFIEVEGIYVKKLLSGFTEEGAFFLALPIIAYGNLVGAIYFLYNDNKFSSRSEIHSTANLKQYYRVLLLSATREYERIVLESKFNKFNNKPEDPIQNYWHIFNDLGEAYEINEKPESPKKINYIFQNKSDYPEPVRIITQNKFLLNLGYDDYYDHLAKVITVEAEQLNKGTQDQIRTAITSIIVDSFAHNIGAHSLAALKWWFEIRYRIAAKKFPINKKLFAEFDPLEIQNTILKHIDHGLDFHSEMDDFEHSIDLKSISLLNIVRFMDEETVSKLWKFTNEDEAEAELPVPVAQSIYHFFQYLRDKSAFWSGVARDTPFGGQVKGWQEIFRNFLNNTLFLGTIAHTEGINKVFFHIEIIDEEGKVLTGGEYAQINLEVIKAEKIREQKGVRKKVKNDDQGYSDYAFLRQGKNFKELHKSLGKLDPIFFPNGIIGQHAFYTLIENTLRNIKHYKSQFDTLSKEGVQLFVSIQEVKFIKRMDDDLELFRDNYSSISKYNLTKKKVIYKIGTWLHHPQRLFNKLGARVNEEDDAFYTYGSVIGAITQQLKSRVVSRDGQPALGGSSQDKVCASMLMNNRFISIDNMNLQEVKRQYFPYVYAASEPYYDLKEKPRGLKYKTDDTILHKVYNEKLIGETSYLRHKSYQRFIKEEYIKEPADLKKEGVIKKYFHIWKGEKCLLANEAFDIRHENPARFKVLAVKNYIKNEALVPLRPKDLTGDREMSAEFVFRKMGLIRVVEAQNPWSQYEDTEKRFEGAMIEWLRDWIGNGFDKFGVVIFREALNGDVSEAVPVWASFLEKQNEEWKFELYNDNDFKLSNHKERILDELLLKQEELTEKKDQGYQQEISSRSLYTAKASNIQYLLLKHGNSPNQSQSEFPCRVRSHTSFFKDLFRGFNLKDFWEADFESQLGTPLKLIETMLTHVSIFDARIYDRLGMKADDTGTPYPNVYSNQLRINAFPEKPEIFRNQRENLLAKKNHFIVMHLSFLESIFRSKEFNMKDDKQKIPYKETEVQEFYKLEFEDMYPKSNDGKTMPHNIIFVITSGRGRGDWFNATKHPQITFRPIEALLDAIEDGLSLKDDFEVKYNLCNVLFGS